MEDGKCKVNEMNEQGKRLNDILNDIDYNKKLC